MIYPLHNTTVWWRHVASRLAFASSTVVVSDLRDADVCITPAFYAALKRGNANQLGLDAFGEDGCAEIITRCRYLRTLDRALAHRMIGAMWQTAEEVIEREAPDVFLSCVVDRYSLDIFERVLRKRGIRYVGLAVGPVHEQIMFMAKGEYLPVREPSDDEVDSSVAPFVAADFLPSYLPARPAYGAMRFAQLYAHFTLRWLAFELIKRWERNPLDFRYHSASNTACGYRVRLRDWRVMRYVDRDWRTAFEATPESRRVFLGLQVTPEAAIEYWVNDLGLIDYDTFFERAAAVLTAAGYKVFVKDHPNQFGFRTLEHIQRLTAIPGVTLVPYEVPARVLIDGCRATVTLTGTVGFEAAMSGRCAVVAEQAYYVADGYFSVLRTAADIDRLPEMVEAFVPPRDLGAARRQMMRHLLRSCVPGALRWVKWSPRLRHESGIDALIESLNRYVPPVMSERPLLT
jgi:hypothetical protein